MLILHFDKILWNSVYSRRSLKSIIILQKLLAWKVSYYFTILKGNNKFQLSFRPRLTKLKLNLNTVRSSSTYSGEESGVIEMSSVGTAK